MSKQKRKRVENVMYRGLRVRRHVDLETFYCRNDINIIIIFFTKIFIRL